MNTNRTRWVVGGIVFAAGFGVAWLVLPRPGAAAEKPPKEIKSRVVPLNETPENKGDWGVMRPYFVGQTHGTDRVYTATGTIHPGKSVHGPIATSKRSIC